MVENLNRALGGLLDADPNTYLLGEDLADPYGGAFKATKGLSSRYPGQVLSTPISESAVVGVAGGLALAGNKAIVEVMFSDFVTLAFDQIVNFASKSVTMYGQWVPIRLIVRCPTGGRRGYGPTHSQSLQKHFMGVPGLSLYELSPFRDSLATFHEMIASGGPCLFFEDKVLYTSRMYLNGVVDDLFSFDHLDARGTVARVWADDGDDPDCVLICPGGLVHRAVSAARSMLIEDELTCQILVPAKLYPFDFEPVLPLLRQSRLICVVEDSTAGGTWGADLAHAIHGLLWGRLGRPVRLVHARDSVIPAAAHLERSVLVQDSTIRRAVKESLANA
ncbi:alpha-ketoacid dehydrogenase subunit beta [Nonomuraea sp. MG754425]|uniref:alpha-ketoacid dehydrogenase subunit beta n=1 Tax=Nonomuraea sp. MG754425 TaxID=2570319 RepID=UPI001F290C68|nr:transketolase C-terminal domain-containing protein [Nonomuraea sp. MG754425]